MLLGVAHTKVIWLPRLLHQFRALRSIHQRLFRIRTPVSLHPFLIRMLSNRLQSHVHGYKLPGRLPTLVTPPLYPLKVSRELGHARLYQLAKGLIVARFRQLVHLCPSVKEHTAHRSPQLVHLRLQGNMDIALRSRWPARPFHEVRVLTVLHYRQLALPNPSTKPGTALRLAQFVALDPCRV